LSKDELDFGFVILKLTEPYLVEVEIQLDNSFINILLAKKLLVQKATLVGQTKENFQKQ